jgi:hypothetical protein
MAGVFCRRRGAIVVAVAAPLLVMSVAGQAIAQGPGARAAMAARGGGGGNGDSESKIKPYDEVITDKAVTDAGLFITHRVGDKLYYEIPQSMLDRDMVWVATLEKTQAGFQWAGMPVNDRVVRWQMKDDETILLRDVNYSIRADTDDPISIAVDNTSFSPVIKAFPVAAWGKDQNAVIDVTSLFTSDVKEFSPATSLGASGLDGSRTFLEGIKAFPENIETRVLATYNLGGRDNGAGGRGFPSAVRRDPTQSGVSVVMHHSMILLPETPMQARFHDDRVGFFSVDFTDYADDSDHEARTKRLITRWRLEKKDPDADLSEPVEPIVWYVSPEVPAKWVPWVIDGIEQWQPAFESAGFKNAIVGKVAPTPQEDPDWDPEDARYTTIRWLPSDVPNAFGPHVHDPRSGEIIEADVRMFHNVMKLVRDWYFVQAGATDERAQKLPMPDDLMGELIAFVVAHEVGHSLGFPHNMKASSSYTVENLRDAEFTKKMGTAPSIMDYARFNYVAQPGDNASLMAAVGPYDHFAVEWGYRQYDSEEAEKAGLAALVAKQVDDPMLRFGDPNAGEDPTQQTEDLTGDAVGATKMGLANLERIADMLISATSSEGEDYHLLETMHGALLGQWAREMGHVANVVGGFERINLWYGDADQRWFPVSKARQQEAVKFLNENAFQTPEMFLDPEVTLRLESSGAAERVLAAQTRLLRALVNDGRIARMSEHAQRDAKGAYTPVELMLDLRDGVFGEMKSSRPTVDYSRRALQRAYIDMLADRMDTADDNGDLPALSRGELVAIRDMARGKTGADEATNRHLADLVARVDHALDPSRTPAEPAQGGGFPFGATDHNLPEWWCTLFSELPQID